MRIEEFKYRSLQVYKIKSQSFHIHEKKEQEVMILQGNYTSSHQISGKQFSVTDKETLDRLTGKADGSV